MTTTPTFDPENLRKISETMKTIAGLARPELFRVLDGYERNHAGIRETDFGHVCGGFDSLRRSVLKANRHGHVDVAQPDVDKIPVEIIDKVIHIHHRLSPIVEHVDSLEVEAIAHTGTCRCARHEIVVLYVGRVTITWCGQTFTREYKL